LRIWYSESKSVSSAALASSLSVFTATVVHPGCKKAQCKLRYKT
jgi:hypothetical protein